MFGKRSLSTGIISFAVAFFLLTGAATAQKLTISSGAPGGIWYGISAGFAKLLSDNGVAATAQPGAPEGPAQ